jgi:capsular polysaccharide biosynthesis protein
LELADILNSLRRRWRIAVGMMLLTAAVVAALYVTRDEPTPIPRYRAQQNILVPARDDKGNLPDDIPPKLLYGQAAIAQSSAVHNTALSNAQVPATAAAGVGFGYKTNETGDLIELSVTAGNPETASRVVSAWADAFLAARGKSVANGAVASQQRAKRGLTVLTNRLQVVESELGAIDPALLNLVPESSSSDGQTPSAASQNVPFNLPIDTSLLIYERAAIQEHIVATRIKAGNDAATGLTPSSYGSVVEIPPVGNVTAPVKSQQTPTLLIVAVGLVLALGVPVLIDRMDHTIRDAKTAAAAFSAPVLSSIPAATRSREYEIAQPGTAREGAFRALAATAVATDRLPRSIVVTSALGEAQDSVAANFAAALANLGVRVALIGTSPRQAWFANNAAANANGNNGHKETTFPELLELAYAGRLNGEAPQHLTRTDIDNLYVLPPGQADIDVSTDGLAPMLQALAAANIDVTVIAAPSLLQDPNTTIYAWTTRSVLWVMETGEITVEEARAAASRLALAGVTPLGVAMVDQES